jgi:hypothetical protein
MTFDYALWKKDFSPDSVPKFPCPSYEHGRLQIEKETLRIVEPQYSKAAHSHDAWEPDWNVQRFSMTLRCNIDTCGEIVIFSGDAPVKMFAGEDDWEYSDTLRPHAVFPAPPIIKINAQTPDAVTNSDK